MNAMSKDEFISLFNQPLDCLSLTEERWSLFIFILRECDLLARYYYLSVKQNVYQKFPEKVKHHLNSAKIKADKQAKQAKFEAVELQKNLSIIGVKPIFLKGVAYNLRELEVSLGRIYADMDILVDKSSLKEIEQQLSFYGWFTKKMDDYDEKYYRLWAHEIPPMQQMSRGTIADIHHNLLPPISGRAPDITFFTEKLHTTTDGLLTLNKPAMVLHSIIHLFFNEEYSNGFRDITDLHLIFTEENQNNSFWQALLTLSAKVNFKLELFYAIRYCQKITKTTFPSSFLEEIEIYKPNYFRLKYVDFIFKNVLIPQHPGCTNINTQIASILAALRGHLLKMPLHILIYHSAHKLFTTLVTLTMKKQLDNTTTIQKVIDKRD